MVAKEYNREAKNMSLKCYTTKKQIERKHEHRTTLSVYGVQVAVSYTGQPQFNFHLEVLYIYL